MSKRKQTTAEESQEDAEECAEELEVKPGDESTEIKPDQIVDRVVAYISSNVKNQHGVADELGNYLVRNPITTEQSIEIWKALEAKGRIYVKR